VTVRVSIALLLALTFFLPASGWTQGQAVREPIRITADRLEADEGARRMTFLGNVVARQGDVAIYAQELALFTEAESREVERVEALRDVRIVQGDRIATGQKGIFFRMEGRFVLTGSPRIHQGDDFIEGDEITVFLDEERSIVRSGDGTRVNAVFHPRGNGP
jgi:lipopolysaccharide export system protein LptA